MVGSGVCDWLTEPPVTLVQYPKNEALQAASGQKLRQPVILILWEAFSILKKAEHIVLTDNLTRFLALQYHQN